MAIFTENPPKTLEMKKLATLLFASTIALTACDTNNQAPAGTNEKLQGNWYGVEISNQLVAQGLWDTLHYHNTSMMTLSLDTADGSIVVDSAGTVLDTAMLVVNNDSSLTITGNTSNLGWAFDADLINAFGQPVLDSLRTLFTGEQNFKVLTLTEDDAVFYFDTIIPVNYGTFQANMELRHTEYWQK